MIHPVKHHCNDSRAFQLSHISDTQIQDWKHTMKWQLNHGQKTYSEYPYYAQMLYQAAAQFSKSSPCTNVPIHCPICPTSVSKAPQTIWKYNALFHLTSEHATDSTPPKIPRQPLADMHITTGSVATAKADVFQ